MTDDPRFELSITLGDAAFQAAGSQEVVMKALGEFKGMLGDGPPSKRARKKPVDDQEQSGVNGEDDTGRKVLPLFLKDVNPKGNALVATAIVAWAELHDGKSGGISPAEGLRLWKKTSMKAPGNLARDMASAAKDGLLEKTGKNYTVTGHGKTQLGLPTH